MNPQLIITLFLKWQIVVISIFVMLLLPIVFYIASLDRRPVKIKQSYVKKSAVAESLAENKTEEQDEQEQNEKNNSEGGKGA